MRPLFAFLICLFLTFTVAGLISLLSPLPSGIKIALGGVAGAAIGFLFYPVLRGE